MTNAKTTKRALFASAMSMLLCVSMLIGSTFAWFTDTASTGVNTIQAGKLEVDLIDATSLASLEGSALDFHDINGNTNILWEPGVTFRTQAFKIKNAGKLALKYRLSLNGVTGDADLLKVISFSIVKADGTAVDLEAFEGTLNESEKSSEIYYIQGTMDTSASNYYQGKTLEGIGVTVVAGQAMHESDSFGDTYDQNANYPWDGTIGKLPANNGNVLTISTATELAAFANDVNVNGNNYSGKIVVLANDIDLNNKIWTPIGQTGATQFLGTFDGDGYTISNLNIDSNAETGTHYSSGLFGWLNSATVKNVKINGAKVTGKHNVAVIAGYLETSGCTISNCSVTNATVVANHVNGEACGDKAGVIVGHAGNPGVKVENCSATDCTVTAGRDAGQIVGAAKVDNVTGCTATNVTVTPTGNCSGANINNAVIGRRL